MQEWSYRVRSPPGGRGFDSPQLQECSSSVLSILGAVPNHLPVAGDDLQSPGDRVLRTDSARLRAHPEFEVLDPVVVLDTVEMVHRLVGAQKTADRLLHDQDVLKDVRASLSGSRMPRSPTHDVARFVERRPAFPVAVVLASHRLTCSAGRGRGLLQRSARTQVSRLSTPASRTQQVSARGLERPMTTPAFLLHPVDLSPDVRPEPTTTLRQSAEGVRLATRP